VANPYDKPYYSFMFNDEIMITYLLVAIYLVLNNQPMMASLLFTTALSVKAGVILMLPGFLGQM
jgi:Gpi18-like mannosyltransferase